MALMAASTICGAPVLGRDGERLGSITELMIDSDTGAVDYAVLSHGGVLGLGEKLFAVPWTALSAAPLAGEFQVDADTAALDAADGIGKDAWPTQADADWIR